MVNVGSVLTALGSTRPYLRATSEVLRAMYYTLPRDMIWHIPIRQRKSLGFQKSKVQQLELARKRNNP